MATASEKPPAAATGKCTAMEAFSQKTQRQGKSTSSSQHEDETSMGLGPTTDQCFLKESKVFNLRASFR